MQREALICPVCGAPYKGVIPADVVHVKCSYCGGTIVIPSTAPRCPNHPNVLAMNMCNDCGNRYCENCLSVYVLEGRGERGALYLCSNCSKQRSVKKAEQNIVLGVLLLFIGFIFFLVVHPIFGILWIAIFTVPIVYGIYKIRQLSRQEVAVYEKPETSSKEESQRTAHEIYHDMLIEYAKSYGISHGSILLENRLKSYMRSGLSREEAVRELAKDGGYD